MHGNNILSAISIKLLLAACILGQEFGCKLAFTLATSAMIEKARPGATAFLVGHCALARGE